MKLCKLPLIVCGLIVTTLIISGCSATSVISTGTYLCKDSNGNTIRKMNVTPEQIIVKKRTRNESYINYLTFDINDLHPKDEIYDRVDREHPYQISVKDRNTVILRRYAVPPFDEESWVFGMMKSTE